MMENELSRLRAWQQYYQHQAAHGGAPPNGAQALTQATPAAGGAMLPPGFQPPHTQQQAPETFRSAGNVQYANGDEHLPQGMTLPEGWTVMPLHRANGPDIQLQPADATQASVPNSSQSIPSVPAPADASGAGSSQQPQPAAPSSNGPTDDHGSPLFLPTVQPATAEPSAPANRQATSTDDATPHSEPATSSAENQTPPQQQSDHSTPWNSEGWSFVDQPNHQPPTNGEAAPSSSAANGSANGAPPAPTPEQQQQSQSYEGKGKARAAEVEDAPDESQ